HITNRNQPVVVTVQFSVIKSITTQNRIGLDDHIVADHSSVANDHIGINNAVFTDPDLISEDCRWMNTSTLSYLYIMKFLLKVRDFREVSVDKVKIPERII